MKKKIVFVAYSNGREGTSALMGLLNKLGMFVTASFKDERNPKGFFEDPAYFQMIQEKLPSFFNGKFPDPPTLEEANRDVDASVDDFRNYFNEVLKDQDNLAVKTPKYFGIFLADRLKDEFDFKIITTQREVEPQVKSIKRMWAGSGDPDLMNATDEQVSNQITKFRSFGEKMVKLHPHLEFYATSFERIMNEKYQSAQEMAEFLGVECPPQSVIEEWLDDKLVNRKKYDATLFQRGMYKVDNFFSKFRKKIKSMTTK